MGWVNTIMQYSIYVVLGLCAACLIISVAVFFALERRWHLVERDVEAFLADKLGRDNPDRAVAPGQWEELCLRFDEMHIMAEESGRPGPYKNIA